MALSEAYLLAEKKIEECWRVREKKLHLDAMKLSELPVSIGKCTHLKELNLSNNQLTTLPDSLKHLTQLQELNLSNNQITILPVSLSRLTEIRTLWLGVYNGGNPLGQLPIWLRDLSKLEVFGAWNCGLTVIPDWIWEMESLTDLGFSGNRLEILSPKVEQLRNLQKLYLNGCDLTELPPSLAQLEYLKILRLDNNPLNPELAKAYEQGLDAVKSYLRAKTEAGQIILTEAKLILVGEGEVGKTCLMDALLDKEWQEHPSTHGIEIQSFKVTDPETQKEITLNGWDFGGQRVYRPTHQLFFSAPAVYLVVWKPREGPQQGFVKEWIQLVKRREPGAKILVVATHDGPRQRQPDIDRQELWDLFGKDTVIDFFFVDSKPDARGNRKGIAELKEAIARVAATLPEVGRSVPKSFADVRAALQATGAPYLPFDEVLAICRAHNMDDEIARLYIAISHRLGHLTHYENDPALRDIVILRPDWLATAMSFIFDDENTRYNHGLVSFQRLSQLWNHRTRAPEFRYPSELHPIFLRLMERFDLSYRAAGLSKDEDTNPISLIAQLVPDTTPKEDDFNRAWSPELTLGDIQQTQICRIVDAQNGQSANAEGLFYQLIVRLHRYSLGRVKYANSVHWQRGLVLDADYNGRALLRYIGNDVHITVRAAYPQGFLNTLTDEVKYLVESFWEGLRCDVMVPCVHPCGKNQPGTNLFQVQKLIAFKRKGLKEFPCTNSGCEQLQDIDQLLLNAPAAQPAPVSELLATQPVLAQLNELRQIVIEQKAEMIGRFDVLDAGQKELLSKAETSYINLIKVFTDEAKEGPRLFSLVPVERSGFNPKQWTSAIFKMILWCEHSRWPLPILNGKDSDKGVYEFEITHEWFKKVAPVLKTITSTLSLILPIVSSAVKLAMDETAYKAIENELYFGKEVIDGVLSGAEKTKIFTDAGDSLDLPHGTVLRAENATLRELHTLLKAKDPGFGGLVRVMNKHQEFLWVHDRFASEY